MLRNRVLDAETLLGISKDIDDILAEATGEDKKFAQKMIRSMLRNRVLDAETLLDILLDIIEDTEYALEEPAGSPSELRAAGNDKTGK
nr:hypothetical protein BaRGS_014426 [Batillaria attramentaria]